MGALIPKDKTTVSQTNYVLIAYYFLNIIKQCGHCFIFFSREGTRKEVENIKKVINIPEILKNCVKKIKG